MNINNHNYQSFLLLYADGELLPSEMEIVDAFVNNHEEAQQFLESLLDARISIEEPFLFPDKALLYKKEKDSINEYNYNSYFLLYVDGELNNAEKTEVDNFVLQQYTLKPILDQLLLTKSTVDSNIIYPNKEELYRKKDKKKIFYLNFKSLAIAAIFIGFIAMIWMITNKEKSEPQIALNIPKDPKNLQATQLNNHEQSATVSTKKSNETEIVSLIENKVNTIAVAKKVSSNNTSRVTKSYKRFATFGTTQTPFVASKTTLNSSSTTIDNQIKNKVSDLTNTLATTPKKTEESQIVETTNNTVLPINSISSLANNTQPSPIIYKTLDIGADDDNVVYLGNMKFNKSKIQNTLKKVTKIFGKSKKAILEEEKTTVASL